MTRWPSHLFLKEADKQALPPEQARSALEVALRVQSSGLPAILTLAHLAKLTGCPYPVLRAAAERYRYFYRDFQIRKRSGGYRRIYVPNHDLARAQRWLCTRVFGAMPIHERAFAYRRGVSIVDWARQHCGCRWLIKFDVRNFFESIDEKHVYRAMTRVGYTPLIAFEIARVCTIGWRPQWNEPVVKRRTDEGRIPAYGGCVVGFVPQGAPSSPPLSNVVCLSLDDALEQVATNEGLVYTRYADDISFSSSDPTFSQGRVRLLRKVVIENLAALGMRENSQKFRVAGPGARRVVGGLLVDTERPRLTRSARARLVRHLHFLKTRGVLAHANARGFSSLGGLRDHVDGLVAHAQQVDADLADEYAALAAQISWPIAL